MRGLRKLKKRISNEEIIILKTDKSGKLAVMKRENYLKMGLEKCRDDKLIDREMLEEATIQPEYGVWPGQQQLRWESD